MIAPVGAHLQHALVLEEAIVALEGHAAPELASASAVGDDEKTIFKGRGYLHKSVVGASGLQNGTTIWTDHDSASHPLEREAMGDQPVTLLGCWHDFVRIRVKKGDGWTKGLCLNQRTTCA